MGFRQPRRKIVPPHRFRYAGRLLLGVTLALLSVDHGVSAAHAEPGPTLSANATVFASGLNNPRGLTFGPNGDLYVAEAGMGGSRSTVGMSSRRPHQQAPMRGA
jgi:hypothetical protein